MEEIRELALSELRRVCSEDQFEFFSTQDLSELTEIVGQDRAVEAIDFGMNINAGGFNVFVLGPPGAGKISAIQRFVKAKAAA